MNIFCLELKLSESKFYFQQFYLYHAKFLAEVLIKKQQQISNKNQLRTRNGSGCLQFDLDNRESM